MNLPGAAAMVAVGLTLGLIGGGGSILTVPILVYIFGIAATEAMGVSLFIVGATSWPAPRRTPRAATSRCRSRRRSPGRRWSPRIWCGGWLVPALPRTISIGPAGRAARRRADVRLRDR